MPCAAQDDDWIKLAPPAVEPTLSANEVPDFLEWLFKDGASKPKPLTLKETAAVVRYLQRLRYHGVPKNILAAGPDAVAKYQRDKREDEHDRRKAVELIMRIVWGTLLQVAPIKSASNQEARNFFAVHQSFLTHPYVRVVRTFLDEFDLPPDTQDPFRMPSLVGPRSATYGTANTHVRSDLSERIAAADYALRHAKIRSRRRLIAAALNESVWAKMRDGEWLDSEVADRVKAYSRTKSSLPARHLIIKWVSSFRHQEDPTAGQHRK